MAGRRIGLALGHGGARGLAHIGVIEALGELGIEPDVVVGTSIGAFVGATFASGALGGLKEWALTVNRQKILGFMDIRFGGGGLIEGGHILDLLKNLGVPSEFEKLQKPFIAVSTDMRTGREVWLRDGSVHAAVLASSAIPGLVRPYRIGDALYLDGALTNPVPASVCRALGAEIVIAVNPAKIRGTTAEKSKREGVKAIVEAWQSWLPALPPSLQPTGEDTHVKPGYLEVVTSSIDIMTEQILRSRLAGDPPHVLLSPQLSGLTILEFDRADEAIEAGRRAVERQETYLREIAAAT